MKKTAFLILLLAFISLASVTMLAQTSNTDNAATEFKAMVHIPIDVLADDTYADLGWIAPGTTRQLPPESKFVMFTISGGQGWAFNASGQIASQCNGASPDVYIDEITWQESSDGVAWTDIVSDMSLNTATAKNLNTDGKFFFRACCNKYHALNSATTDGTPSGSLRTFNATLTAVYADM